MIVRGIARTTRDNPTPSRGGACRRSARRTLLRRSGGKMDVDLAPLPEGITYDGRVLLDYLVGFDQDLGLKRRS